MEKVTVSYETQSATITERNYRAFQVAYDFLNKWLFGNSLPPCTGDLTAARKAKGYLATVRFEGRTDSAKAHELAMNPDVFTGRSDELIVSTLTHEMVHVWQQTHGRVPRRAYHDSNGPPR